MGIAVTVRPFDLPPPRGLWRRAAGTDGQRLIAIGDIHGRWDLLAALIKTIEAHVAAAPKRLDQLVFLGDFVDRGPDSQRIIRFLRTAQANAPRVHVLLGNHEQALLHAIEGDADAQRLWLDHGAEATLASYGIALPGPNEDRLAFATRVATAIGPDTIDWLRDLPSSLRFGGYFFCHAGIRPGRPLRHQTVDDLIWIRDAFIDSDRHHGAVIVHGHTITPEIDIRHNRIGVDTGAYRTGRLSAVILGDDGNWALSTAPDDAV
jgi:serine/threonine protein phosphatase 1